MHTGGVWAALGPVVELTTIGCVFGVPRILVCTGWPGKGFGFGFGA